MALTKNDLEQIGGLMDTRFEVADRRMDVKLAAFGEKLKIEVVDEMSAVNRDMLNEIGSPVHDHELRITKLERWREA